MIAPRDPSPRGGFARRAHLDNLRAILRDRIRRSSHVGVGCQWGFVLTGEMGGGRSAADYGSLYVITLDDAVAVTPALVEATKGTPLYLLGCMRATMDMPEICWEMSWAEHSPLPAVAVRAVLGCTLSTLGGGHIEMTIEADQACRTPLVFLTSEPIPGWPR